MRIPHNEPLGSDNLEASERRCILTGDKGSRAELIRLAISPAKADGSCDVLPDALARAPGRGAWIGVSRTELESAISSGKLKGALARAFKGAPLSIPADLGERTENALRRAFLDRLGLEMRAGKLILGTDRIAEHARGGAIAWLGHAADASTDGSRKLDQAFRVGKDAEGSGITGDRLPLDRTALSVALGRENVVHLALADRASAQRVGAPLGRLVRFLGTNPAVEETSGQTGHEAARAAITTNKEYEG